MANKKKDPSLPDFESTLKKLETIVGQLESSELTLEQAMKAFEEGVALTRQCQQALRSAELRVQELTNENIPPTETVQD